MSHPAFLRIPDEILSLILFDTAYTGGEFGDDIEYDTPTERRGPTGVKHMAFARSVLPVSKRFFRIGIQVVWRNIIVRSGDALAQVAEQSALYGTYTWRLEMRIGGTFDTALVRDVVRPMVHLNAFILRNFPADAFSDAVLDPRSVVDALCEHCPAVRRIQFDSSLLLPTAENVCDVLRANPQLQTLRVAHLPPESLTHSPADTHLSIGDGGSCMQTLSLGVNHWTFPSEYSARAQDTLLFVLTERASLSSINSFHMLEFSQAVVPFLRRYGPRIQDMIFTMPDHHSPTLHDAELLQLCPALEEVVWVGKNWRTIDAAHALPTHHSVLRKATIICSKMEYEVPPLFVTFVQRLLYVLRDGHFPSLRKIVVDVRGGTTPDLRECEWFRELEGALRCRQTGGIGHQSVDIVIA